MPTLTPLRFGYNFGNHELPPEFAYPPLIETWLGVDFAPPASLLDVSAGEWRQRLGPEWPAAWQSIGPAERHAPGRPEIEQQLRNVMGDRAIRFHENGFCFGWLGYEGNLYARYEAIRDGFVATLDSVQDVMPKLGQPHRWNVTYVNRIPQGSVWSSPADWSFFRLWQPNPLKKLKIEPEGFVGQWQFPLDAERGTLCIELTHEPIVDSGSELEYLWLRLTASGVIESHEAALFDGLDYGREICVRAFNELVTTDAKQFWGERELPTKRDLPSKK
ncbi:hypothetical protein [Schlesneria sp. DSM 10557]|uniref:hypothetical protein n=1 Tax=Schlesneria sp. DSM 10557 TaxID=3044399 RepID=UPI0035A1C6B8